MKITVIGTGYVGLVSAVCFASLGHEVVGVDKDEAKILGLKNNIIPIFENGLKEHEYDHVFMGISDAVPVCDKDEVSDWRYEKISTICNTM